MSIKVTSLVWDNAPVDGTELVVLLIIADHASDDGTNAWPSVATIARKARRSERRVQQAIAKLVADGLIRVDINAGGTRQYTNRPNLYEVVMARISTGVKPTSPSDVTGVKPTSPPPVKPTSPEPSLEPSKRPLRKRDEVFEVLAQVGGHKLEQLTDLERGRLNKAAKELRAVGATPDQIRAAARAWTVRFPQARMTAMALANHWSSLAPEQRTATCHTCGQPLTDHEDDLCRLFGG